MFLLESVTSIVIVVIVGVGYIFIRFLNTMSVWQRTLLLLLAIIGPLIFLWHIYDIVMDATTAPKIDYSSLDVATEYGNP